jgi:hypothetical protein
MYYFAHIPKAGGTTLKQMFYEAYGNENCLKIWDSHTSNVKAALFAKLSETELLSYQAVVGHLRVEQFFENPNIDTFLTKKGLKTVTIIREPISRLISLYNYMAVCKEHPSHEKIKNTKAINFLLSHPENFQFNFLRRSTESTIDNISRDVRLVSLESSVEVFARLLFEATGIKVKKIPPQNVTSNLDRKFRYFSKSDLSSSEIDLLSKKHSLDIELYKKALMSDKEYLNVN